MENPESVNSGAIGFDVGDLIFVSLESWDEIWRRNQFVCERLIARNPERRIVFVQPAIDVSNAVRMGRLRHLLQPRERVTGAEGRITCTQAIKLLPNSWKWARKVNEWMLQFHLRRIARRLGFFKPLLWINAHGAVHLANQLDESAVIYDVTDDWTQFPETPAMLELTKAQDAELCEKADAVIVCSRHLHDLKRPLARSVHLIPNGVDADHYKEAGDTEGSLPEDARSWKGPVIGYTGSIHPDRVDVALVEEIARRMPKFTFVLLGPLMLPDLELRILRSLPNLVLAGPRPYSRIPDYMKAFDICMTPHVVTPFTESLNPIKLWEYLAAGKPIISTPVAGFRDYPEFVSLVSDAEGFEKAVAQCLVEEAGLRERRRTEARRNSWESRVKEIEDVIGQCIQARASGDRRELLRSGLIHASGGNL